MNAGIVHRFDVAAIAGHEGYGVTRAGEVISLRTGKPLKLQITYRGYIQIKLGAGRWHLVHRLVADAFIPNPGLKPQVNHIDGNPFNNAAHNLEWVTQSENTLHAYRTGLAKPPIWSDESKSKMAASHRGRKTTPEQRARMSAARTGKGKAAKSPEHRVKISEALRRRFA